MVMSTVTFLGVRALHVLVAAMWFGSAVFISRLLTPAVAESGPAGGLVMARINGRLSKFMAIISLTTVLSGIYLFWHFTGGFDPAAAATHAGLAFGMGGVAGLLALAVGVAVGRSIEQLQLVMGQAMPLPDGPPKAALLQRSAALRRRVSRFTTLVIALQSAAIVLMALGHYV